LRHFGKKSPKHNRRIWLKITKFMDGFRRALGYDSHAPTGGEDGAMLLQCESEGRGDGPTTGWLRAGTLESLVELNELCLGLIAEQAAAHGATGSALLRQVGELWCELDAPARRRAAACPYLLLDAGFADTARWRAAAAPRVGDTAGGYAAFFTVPAAAELAQLVFTYAWHLARSQTAAARLLLGMPPGSALVIGRCTLRQIHRLAAGHADWLKPRWPARVVVWRGLLLAAAAGDSLALERIRLRGLTLLAGEARMAPPERPAWRAPRS
jgi:hypothetical protein